MKLPLMLLVLLWEKVDLTLTQQECLKLPTVEHAFVSDQYKKAEYQEGDVIYFSCDPGYTTGLNTTYICTEHGWRAALKGQCIENTFPVALGCTRPPPLKNGYVLENSTYFYVNGQRVGFQCNNLYTMKGGPYKTCTNGKWTGDLQCLFNFCEKPESDNFKVGGDKMMYREGEVLRYSCNRGHRKVDGRPSVCRKQGLSPQWTPMPQCELIACKLHPNPPEGTTYDPQNQLIFTPGQSVRVLCREKQWVKSKEFQSTELTCQGTGRWYFTPVCQQVTCSKTAENVYYWEHTRYNTVEMDQMLQYRCHEGYEETSPMAKCTRRGWEPDPLCEVISCEKPESDNFKADEDKVMYRESEVLRYSCNPGYRKVDGRPSVCRKRGHSAQWIPMPLCEPISCPSISVPDNVQVYGDLDQPMSGTVLQFNCTFRGDELIGAAQIFCDENGKWSQEPPTCQEISCVKPVSDNFKVDGDKMMYKEGEMLRYSCNHGYRKVDGRPSVCRKQGLSAQWTPMPQCELMLEII